MTAFQQLVEQIEEINDELLVSWIEEGWVRPNRVGKSYAFSDMDVARVHMLRDIHFTLQIEIESVPVVLNLLDQLYGHRRQLNAISAAIAVQPEEVRQQITEEATRRLSGSAD